MVNLAAFSDDSFVDPTHSLSLHSETTDQMLHALQTWLFLTKPLSMSSAKQIKTGNGTMVTNYSAVAS
jgi:hypothetical protein